MYIVLDVKLVMVLNTLRDESFCYAVIFINKDNEWYISGDDDQSILIETSSCNLQFFSELITTQLRDFHMVSPQVVFTLLIFLTMQSYKFDIFTDIVWTV